MTSLAQLNIAEMRYTSDDPRMADFMDALIPVNHAAEQAPGFIWRLKDESDNATSIQFFGRDDLLVNLSVWESMESLQAFVRSPIHLAIMHRRAEWFHSSDSASLVLWWLESESFPTVEDAEKRLIHLRHHGPSEEAFNFASPFLPPTPM